MQSPAPPGWRPPVNRGPSPALILIAVFAILAVVIVGAVVVATWGSNPLSAVATLLLPLCALFFVVVGIIAAVASGAFRSRVNLPPPPPVQQPMVPAGLQGPIAINCPNCGAPPGSVDRFGVAICTHCGTRYIVR